MRRNFDDSSADFFAASAIKRSGSELLLDRVAKRRGVGGLSTVALASMFVLAPTFTAHASTEPESGMHVVSTKTITNPECVAQIGAAQKRGATTLTLATCPHVSTLEVGPSAAVTALPSSGPLPRGASSRAFAAAAAAGSVRKAPFKQTYNNITDGEEQYGYVYYDGSHVWITTYRGYTGQHICKLDWGVAFDVSNTGCGDSGSPSLRSVYQKWKFAAGFKGSPVAWEEVYTVHATASGSISQ